MARHERARPMKKKVVGLGPIAAADDVNVARAARDDQADGRAFALDQRVDGDGRAVDQVVDRFWVEACLVNAIDDAFDRIGGVVRLLACWMRSRALVEGDQIGERAADIDSDPQAHSMLFLPKASADRK